MDSLRDPCAWNARLHKRVCGHGAQAPLLGGPGTVNRPTQSEDHDTSSGSEALCKIMAQQQLEDLKIAAAATRDGADAPAVMNVHLVYVHIHGHVNHYYHFLHDALLTFFPLYTSFTDDAGNPTISRVVLWNQQSFGPFSPIFEAVYGVRVDEVPCKCEPGSCAEVTTDHDPRGSRTLDAPLQLEGLYPFYFDEVGLLLARSSVGAFVPQIRVRVRLISSYLPCRRPSSSSPVGSSGPAPRHSRTRVSPRLAGGPSSLWSWADARSTYCRPASGAFYSLNAPGCRTAPPSPADL